MFVIKDKRAINNIEHSKREHLKHSNFSQKLWSKMESQHIKNGSRITMIVADKNTLWVRGIYIHLWAI